MKNLKIIFETNQQFYLEFEQKQQNLHSLQGKTFDPLNRVNQK